PGAGDTTGGTTRGTVGGCADAACDTIPAISNRLGKVRIVNTPERLSVDPRVPRYRLILSMSAIAVALAVASGALLIVRITNRLSSRNTFIWLMPGTKKAALPTPGTSSIFLSLN